MCGEAAVIAENLARIWERVERAAGRAGRSAEEITIVAVSKTHAAEAIRAAYEAGVRHFGENRVQEWESKRALLHGLDATWHLIGHLQSNKAARAAGLFHTIDSVDSIGLAERLEKAAAEAAHRGARRLRVLMEVKLDPEPAKTGAEERELPRLARAILQMPHLELRGLMGIPPLFDDAERARPYFRHLRELHDALREQLGAEAFSVLSMGMSHDFEVAIEEGATEIRVGTALFGERPRPPGT